jgi:hypothetical protein
VDRIQTIVPVQTRAAGWLPGPVAETIYASFEINTISVLTRKGCQNFQEFDIHCTQAAFDPNLPCHCTVYNFETHWPRGAFLSIYWTTSLQRVFRRSFVSRRGIINQQRRSVNEWMAIPWDALESGQDIESYDRTGKESN